MSEKPELLVIPETWEIPYEYSVGETVSRFLVELRDNGRILATKCPECQRVILPPSSFCDRCFVPIKDGWVELSPVGELRAFTIVDTKFAGLPDPPYVVCFVTLGESSTTIAHFLEGVDLGDVEKARQELRVGMPVRAVFKDKVERKGRLTDFRVELVK